MQTIGETREEMTKGLMKKIEHVINTTKMDNYYITVHAKPFPNNPFVIKQRLIITKQRPPEMLSCMLFHVDNKEGKLTLEWALPGDWPTQDVERTTPVAETIASYEKLENGLQMRYAQLKDEIKASSA